LGIRGSGIGLTIVKKIVEDHGGYLSLDSRPGEGSMFTVRIPAGGT
jgi:signal transduction histidine kinase